MSVFFATSKAARIAGFFLLNGAIASVIYESMWSMAGITVARLGVAREKYVVASLRICRALMMSQ